VGVFPLALERMSSVTWVAYTIMEDEKNVMDYKSFFKRWLQKSMPLEGVAEAIKMLFCCSNE